eukprot:365896-Chlamydomonas_euryale.AAC.5
MALCTTGSTVSAAACRVDVTCPAWHAAWMSCALHGMPHGCHVPCMACRVDVMCPAWHAAWMSCALHGMPHGCHVPCMACRVDVMCPAWHACGHVAFLLSTTQLCGRKVGGARDCQLGQVGQVGIGTQCTNYSRADGRSAPCYRSGRLIQAHRATAAMHVYQCRTIADARVAALSEILERHQAEGPYPSWGFRSEYAGNKSKPTMVDLSCGLMPASKWWHSLPGVIKTVGKSDISIRLKHIDVRCHLIKDHVAKNDVNHVR